MAGKSTTKPEIPEMPDGLSPAEEARWWDEHHEYWDLIDTPIEVMEPQPMIKSQEVKIWLPEPLIAGLKDEAARQGVNYHLVIKAWLEDRLNAKARKPAHKTAKKGEGTQTGAAPIVGSRPD